MIHSYALTCSQTLKQIILNQVLQTMDSIMIRNMIKKCKISSYQQFTFHSLDFMVSYWLILVVYMNNRKTRCTDNLLYYYSKRIDMIYKKQYFYISPESVCQCDVKRSTILQTAHLLCRATTMLRSCHPESMAVCLDSTSHCRYDQRWRSMTAISRVANGYHVTFQNKHANKVCVCNT